MEDGDWDPEDAEGSQAQSRADSVGKYDAARGGNSFRRASDLLVQYLIEAVHDAAHADDNVTP